MKASGANRDVCPGGWKARGRREKAGCRWRGAPNGQRRTRIEPTEDWGQLELLLKWPEQVEYERIRPPVVFGSPVAERARQTGTPESTLRRRIAGFENEGMRSLFKAEQAERRGTLDPEIRRLILDLKIEHPPMRVNEMATICYVRFGERPHGRTVRRVLETMPRAIRMFRRFEPYHAMEDAKERRLAILRLHSEGWNVKSIAGYLKSSRPTVYRTLKKWIAEGVHGLEDKPRGGVRKVDLRAMKEVRKLQENPELGESRVSAALEQLGIHLSPRTCGRILAVNRKLYGLKKPKRGPREKKEMPFHSTRRHEIWSVDVRYIDHRLPPSELPTGGKVYAISILENHSRALLASAISTSQDLTAYLSVLYTAVERYGSPQVLVSDGGAIFGANQAKAVYRALGITKEEIERRKPWQNFIETTFNIQRRTADYYFAKAGSWEELVDAHDGWVERYNTQRHWAHRERKDGRHSPSEVLGFLTGVRHRPEELRRAFFSTRFTRTLDASGYARLKHWRVYGEEGLARREVALWPGTESLAVEYAGDTLARCDVEHSARTNRLREVKRARLFETAHQQGLAQLRLFELDVLGEAGWLKALKLEAYAPRKSGRPQAFLHSRHSSPTPRRPSSSGHGGKSAIGGTDICNVSMARFGEDTYNLLGHALRKALGVIARQQGRGLAEVAAKAGALVVDGTRSLKAALECDRDDPNERALALVRVLEALDAVEEYLDRRPGDDDDAGIGIARRMREQDVKERPGEAPELIRGVARERLVSVEDPRMRHGRKSKSVRFCGYKRHVLRDLDSELVRAVGVTPANAPEASVTEGISTDLGRQGVELSELHIDRAYLSSELVRERSPELKVYCKAWRVGNGEHFPKTAFEMDWERGLLRCPAGAVIPFESGGVVRFPKKKCAECPLRERCTRSKSGGRRVSIHPDERLLTELRERQLTPEGRTKLRERVKVEHSLAHVGQ